jgi:phospholipase C
MTTSNQNPNQQAGGWLSSLISNVLAFLARLFQPRNKPQPAIEHVIVLMFENRSFDHMTGYFRSGGGLTGSEFNPLDPEEPTSGKVLVNDQADYITPTDPDHDFLSVSRQLFGREGQVIDPAPMNGFVAAYLRKTQGDIQAAKKIMQCFSPDKLPALRTLAEEFCLCNRWFSSLPGPTWPNRFFVHAATSDGNVSNDVTHLYDMKTVYNSLSENGWSWNIYFGDIPHSLTLERLWPSLSHFKSLDRFHADVENGELANYTFIEPRYLDFLQWKANDEHPPHDIKLGEYLLAEIYETIRNSKFWEKSLLVVLYDEHGGFYDAVSPPIGVPNPDGQVSTDPAFDFTRLGVRVPAVLVSPYIEKGVVDSTVYEHASVPATLKTIFKLPSFLTNRDKAASTFEKALTRGTPRSDAPLTLPVPGDPAQASAYRALIRTKASAPVALAQAAPADMSQEPLSEFQVTLLQLAERLNARRQAPTAAPTAAPPPQIQTEYEAAVYIQDSIARFLNL